MDSILNSVSGVTTRLQREQLQQKQDCNNQLASLTGSSGGLAISSVENGLEPSDNGAEEENSTLLASNNSNEPCSGEREDANATTGTAASSLNLNSSNSCSNNQLNSNPSLIKDESATSTVPSGLSSPSPFKSESSSVMKFSSSTTSMTATTTSTTSSASLVMHNSLPVSSSPSAAQQINSVPSDSNGSLLPSSDAQSASVSSAMSMTLNTVAVSSNNNHILNR